MDGSVILNLSAQNIITCSALIGAIITIIVYFNKAHNWFLKQEKQSEEILELKKLIVEKECSIKDNHNSDINAIKSEQTILVYGVLACLKGLKEKGCDGPVSKAIDDIEKYLNKKAHEEL